MQNEIFLHTPRLTLGPLREGDKAALVHNVSPDAHRADNIRGGGNDDFSDFLK